MTEKWITDLSGARDAILSGFIDQVELIAFGIFGGNLNVFAQLDGALGTEYERAAISPAPQSVGSCPIDAIVTGSTIVRRERGLAEVVDDDGDALAFAGC